MVAAVFFVFNTEALSTNTGFPGSGKIGGLTVLALLVWVIFGLFCADHWYQPLLAVLIGVVLSPIPNAISKHLTTIFGVAGMVVAPLCVIAGYIIWF